MLAELGKVGWGRGCAQLWGLVPTGMGWDGVGGGGPIGRGVPEAGARFGVNNPNFGVFLSFLEEGAVYFSRNLLIAALTELRGCSPVMGPGGGG